MKTRSPNVWDRTSRETAPAYEAFRAFRDLGERRTLDGVVRVLKRKASYRRVLTRWSAQHDWAARALAWDARLHDARDRVAIDRVVEAQERLRARSVELVDRLLEVALGAAQSVVDGDSSSTSTVTGAEVRALLGAIDRAGITATRRVDHTTKGEALGAVINPAELSDAALLELASQLGCDDESD